MASIWEGNFVLGNTSATQISAGPGIKLDTSVPGVIGISNDETVLFEGEITGPSTYSAISEPISSFETVKIYARLNRSTPDAGQWFEFPTNKDYITILGGLTNTTTSAGNAYVGIAMLSFTGNEIKYYNGRQQMFGSTTASTSMNAGIYKVVGINRKQNGGN